MDTRILMVVAVALSALLFTVPVVLFNRIRGLDEQGQRGRFWWLLLVLCIGFYMGYVGEAAHLLLSAHVNNDDLRVVAILTGGSLFVLLVAVVFYRMVLRLDQEVKDRAAKLTLAYAERLQKEKEAQRLKDHFIFVAAHELRTPVTSLRWGLDLIKESPTCQGASDEMRGIIAMLSRSVNRLTGLVNDLLDTSRLEYGTIDLKPEPVVVGELVESVVSELAPIAKKEGLTLQATPGESGGQRIQADPRRLRDVLINLIANSLKFTPAGGKVKVGLTHDDRKVIFSVIDSGVGLDPAEMELLFRKFSRPDNHPKGAEIESTGLGLFIAKQLVEKWGGRIWAESEGRGQGATFRFTVPYNSD